LENTPPPPRRRGEISADVIWGKKMRKGEEKREYVKQKGIKGGKEK
jgi:hypothetical protein